MGLGAPTLTTNAKKEPAGPPFVAGSADNGLSVAAAGEIVLGNNTAEVGSPAILLSNREIPTGDAAGLTGPFNVTLNDFFNQATTLLAGGVITLDEVLGTLQTAINIFSSGNAGAALVLQQFPIKFRVLTNATDVVISSASSNIGVMRFQQVSPFGVHFHAASGNAYNSATVQISGTTTFRRFSVSTGVNVNIDRDLDSGKLWRNSAAVNLTLPNMAGANARPGFILRAWCDNAAGLTITASAGQVIRFGGTLVTSSGGTLSTTDLGASVTIVNIDSATWITESFLGAWALT